MRLVCALCVSGVLACSLMCGLIQKLLKNSEIVSTAHVVEASTFDKRNAKNPFKNPKIDLKLWGKENKNIME